jgi:demethylmenaquinone methyltransferase/2-methoxy-6-polyprenyl-1,4-benzoquinol methylase
LLAAARALPDAADKSAVVRAMFDRIAPRYDLVNSVMTLGRDRAWRRATIAAAEIGPGDRVADVACGTGDLVELAARKGARVVGIDFSAGMLGIAARRGMRGRIVHGDALALPLPDASLDALTSAFALRNFVAIPTFLAEAARVLRPGGRLALLEIAAPGSRLPRALHRAYLHRAVPALGALLSEHAAYAYLPASTAYLPAADALVRMICAAGFVDVRRRSMSLGAVQLLSGRRTAAARGER